jgi:hypothetical protein
VDDGSVAVGMVGEEMTVAPWSGRRCSDNATDKQAPHGLIFSRFLQNWFKVLNSK